MKNLILNPLQNQARASKIEKTKKINDIVYSSRPGLHVLKYSIA